MTYCSQLIDPAFQTIDIHDKISDVILNMETLEITYMPVLDGVHYVGMIKEEDLLDADPTKEIISLDRFFIKPFVKTGDHFLMALRVRSRFKVDFVPVVDEKNEWQGVIGMEQMLDQVSLMTGVMDTGSMLVLEVTRHDYALGEINRLVESNDAMIMHLNTISDQLSDHIQIVMRINKEDISDIVATFQRHEYQVLFYYGEESYGNSLQSNLDHLLNYLNI